PLPEIRSWLQAHCERLTPYWASVLVARDVASGKVHLTSACLRLRAGRHSDCLALLWQLGAKDCLLPSIGQFNDRLTQSLLPPVRNIQQILLFVAMFQDRVLVRLVNNHIYRKIDIRCADPCGVERQAADL